MAETGSRRGAASASSLILAIAAFVTIGGLVYWLNVTAEPTERESMTADTAAEEEPVSDVPIVDMENLRAETEGYVNLEIEMRNEGVNSLLGDEAFWIGPEDNPFLVKMTDQVEGAQPGSIAPEDSVDLRGTIMSMSDSILDAWEEQGVISGQGERAVASFAEVFMNATRVRVANEGQQESGQNGDDAEGE